MLTPEAFIRLVVEKFDSGKGSLFIGSGISADAGLPTWDGLGKTVAEELGRRLGWRRTEIKKLYALSTPDLLNRHKKHFGDREMRTFLRGTLSASRVKNPSMHELIASIPNTPFVTTNVDQLLEQALVRSGEDPFVVWQGEQISYRFPGERLVVKIHGDVDHPETMVFTNDDYYYSDSYRARLQALAPILHEVLVTRTCLFLGCSLRDHTMMSHVMRVAAAGPSIRKYAVVVGDELRVADPLADQGFEILHLDTPEKFDLWLKDLFISMNTKDD